MPPDAGTGRHRGPLTRENEVEERNARPRLDRPVAPPWLPRGPPVSGSKRRWLEITIRSVTESRSPSTLHDGGYVS
jgi:hypothetical protein